MVQRVKDLVLSLQQLRWLLWHGFDPWPRSVGWGSGLSVGCGVGWRCGSELALLWLRRRPVATALI